MSEAEYLLDTPKKQSLQSQSSSLRISLKEFERTFATTHGHKPSREDIRAHDEIAAQYKTYNRVRDVLAGRLSYEEFICPVRASPKKTAHRRSESRVSRTSQKRRTQETPQKQLHPSHIDPYDAPNSSSPRPLLLTAIGPTPQRDGKVLGLFDLISGSAAKSQTASTTLHKRKRDAILEESPQKAQVEPSVLQTPASKRRRNEEDILRHLEGTPGMTPQTGRNNHSRTPISEGRKFMLSQFFATPSAIRYQNADTDGRKAGQTPLRDRILGLTPRSVVAPLEPLDATPAYLKRSTSFKDRLMSASNNSRDNNGLKSPVSLSTGPPTLRHFRAASKPLSQILQDLRHIEEGDHDDDLDALREMEDFQTNVRVQEIGHAGVDKINVADENSDMGPTWKKRGQKRTTKRSKMRPAKAKIAEAPKFVSAEDHDQEAETHERGQSIQAPSKNASHWVDEDFSDASFSDIDEIDLDNVSDDTRQKSHKNKSKRDGKSDKKDTSGPKTGKINPNAQSHMNFRTLKIRNKNSKAKGGGRFGRRR